MPIRGLILAVATFLATPASGSNSTTGDSPTEWRVYPKQAVLHGRQAFQRLIVSGTVAGKDTQATDRTRFRSATPDVVAVDDRGWITPVSDGEGRVVAEIDGQSLEARVTVREAGRTLPVTLERDVVPLLTRLGCNAGPCHGKQRGQNGFQLSLLGFDPAFDLQAIAVEARGRRVFPAAPQESLLLQKGTAAIPHGGGKRLEQDSAAYAILHDWIASGLPRDPAGAPTITELRVEPSGLVLDLNARHPLVVTAVFGDGTTRDVTDLAAYQSSESAIVAVDEAGVVRSGAIPGEAAITARYRGRFATTYVTIPLPGATDPSIYAALPRRNFIDEWTWKKLESLGITPSGPADDPTLLRRAFLDVIGRLPTADEARSYLADPSPDKFDRLVDRLLNRPEYADHWAGKWADLLRPNPYRVGIKAVLNLDAWLRDVFRRNLPYDVFVRQVVTARGSTWQPGASTVFRDRREPEELTTMFSQLFLGIRLECAKCHHHPFESWSQDDFYGFAAYFARVGRKGTGLSPPISGGEEIVFTTKTAKKVVHPVTEQPMEPRPLFGATPEVSNPDADPRDALADWMTAPENSYFAKVIVNRVWAEILGRGIVEPVDDLRATNPPTNAPLLDALAENFRVNGYDLKQLIRTILGSQVYRLSSEPNPRNLADTRNASRHYRQRLRAEVLLDAISDVTGVPESFDAAPPGTRATALWTARIDSLFLDSFGRPDRNQDPPCERTPDTSVVQALHLMNAPGVHAKITSDNGLPARLAASGKPPDAMVEELYLTAYARYPTDAERSIGEELFQQARSPREAAEDLLWALINTPEFVFKN